MKRRLCTLALVFALAGCSIDIGKPAGHAAGAADTAGQPTATPSAPSRSGLGSAKESGDIPDPCTLLERSEVVDLTGRQITQIDRDGAEPGTPTRFCQWQLDGGQLAIFLARTTPGDFDVQIAGAERVEGVGEDAFSLAGHLYVLYGTVQIDVYARGGDDDRNLADAKEVAEVLIPRV